MSRVPQKGLRNGNPVQQRPYEVRIDIELSWALWHSEDATIPWY
jgi:hypothetical protein